MRRVRPERPLASPLVLVVAAALAGGVLLAAAPARAADVTGSVDGVQVRDGSLEFLLTAPAGSTTVPVDPASVVVTVAGRPTDAIAVPAQGDRVLRRLVLLIDVSGSMKGRGITAATAAADGLVRAVAPDVEVGLVTFDDTATVVVPPTRERVTIRSALAGLTAKDETALYDGVGAALAALGPVGDRTVVLLSDGGDTVSLATLQTTTQQLGASGVRAEVVGFRTDETQDTVLATLASAGHGHVTTAQDQDGLTRAFGAVATTLASQVQVSADLPTDLGGEQDVQVSATAGADRLLATTQVRLPVVVPDGASAPAPAPRADAVAIAAGVPALFATPWPAVAAFALLGVVLVYLLSGLAGRARPRTRLEQIAFFGISGRPIPRPQDQLDTVHQRGQALLDVAERFVRRRGLEDGLALLLDRADLPWRPHEYLVLRVAGAMAALAVAVVLGDSWALSVVALPVGWFVVTAYVRWRARSRIARFADQLPDALALVASSLQTGFSLHQALDAVSRDTTDPLRGQFSRAMAENRLGADLEDALDRVATRMDCEDLAWTVMAIRIQRQVGGNLASTLRTTTSTLRERSSLRRQVQALSADGRVSAYVLLALPPLLGLGLLVISPDYVSALWTEPLGLLMLAVATAGMVLGSVWIRQLVRVEM